MIWIWREIYSKSHFPLVFYIAYATGGPNIGIFLIQFTLLLGEHGNALEVKK